MKNKSGRLYGIGELADRTGISVRTIRFWSDAGIVAPTTLSPAGHRLYDDQAVAKVELVGSLRHLGLGLDTIRSVLEKRKTVKEVAAVHAQALETEIQTLKLRRAVLISISNRKSNTKEMKMINDLANLSAAERRRLVDEFIAETFGELDDKSGIGERMRQATPALPDDPTPEQVDAWIEVGKLVQDPSFRERVRKMAEAGARESQEFDREAGKDFAARVAEHAGPAVEAGVDPASKPAAEILKKIVPDDDQASRARIAKQIETFADRRVNRYWELVGTINGWPPFPQTFESFEWVIAALKAHPAGT